MEFVNKLHFFLKLFLIILLNDVMKIKRWSLYTYLLASLFKKLFNKAKTYRFSSSAHDLLAG